MELMFQVLAYLLGGLFPLWARALVGADTFSLSVFWAENQGRLTLLLIGAILINGLLLLDPQGVTTLLSQAGIAVDVGSRGVLGAAVTAVLLVIPKSEGK